MVTSSPNLRMDGGIRCWGVCLTSALIQMITIGVSNCFGVIKQVNDNKSGKMCNGSLQNKPWHAVSCQFQLKVEKCTKYCIWDFESVNIVNSLQTEAPKLPGYIYK